MRSRREARLLLVALTLALVAVGAQSTRGGNSTDLGITPPRVGYALRLAHAAYGVPLAELRAVSFCESRWNPRADGYSGAGLFQFTTATWVRTPFRRFSPLDPVAASLAAGWLVTQDHGWRQWTCRP